MKPYRREIIIFDFYFDVVPVINIFSEESSDDYLLIDNNI